MAEKTPYEDENVFEKLEREASRHHHASSHRKHYNVKPTVHKPSLPNDASKHVSVHSDEKGDKAGNPGKAGEDAPPSSAGKNTGSNRADEVHKGETPEKTEKVDLAEEIRTELKQRTGEISSVEIVSSEKRNRDHHSAKRSSRKKIAKKRIGSAGRKHRGLRVLAVILALVVAVGALGFGVLQTKLNKIERTDGTEDTVSMDDEFDRENLFDVESFEPKLLTSEDVTNILLIGQDRRKGDKAEMRSDAMIVCSINEKTKEITLTSLMRDMYLPVPGKGYGMINATYLAGGFPLLNKTIEKNFGIRIDGNLEVDFERFIGLMSLIGPIDLDLSQAEADHLNQSGNHFKAGVNTLDSEQVLAYCRMRKDIGGDWGRTDRQRKVLTRIYQELKTSGMGTIYRFIDEALPLFRTDLSNRKMIRLAYAMVSGRMGIRHSYRIPEEGTYTQEIREDTLHVLIPDLKENCRRIQKYIYGYLEDD